MRSGLLLSVALLAGGCVSHISPYTPRHRDFDEGTYGKAQASASNSLYSRSSHGLFEDDRARAIGDVVFIQIDEASQAQNQGASKLSKKGNISLGLSGGLVDMLQKAVPAMQLAKLLGVDSSSGFDGSGNIQKSGKLQAVLPVRVQKVMPNGDLYVEGTKVVMVGSEENHLYVSGIVRSVDIHNDGTVSSSRVADAEIEYTGRGDITDHTKPGWLHKIYNKVSPL
jgi:flagellar L-ring protein precursor FlgH